MGGLVSRSGEGSGSGSQGLLSSVGTSSQPAGPNPGPVTAG
jgi:hypothetical protein